MKRDDLNIIAIVILTILLFFMITKISIGEIKTPHVKEDLTNEVILNIEEENSASENMENEESLNNVISDKDLMKKISGVWNNDRLFHTGGLYIVFILREDGTATLLGMALYGDIFNKDETEFIFDTTYKLVSTSVDSFDLIIDRVDSTKNTNAIGTLDKNKIFEHIKCIIDDEYTLNVEIPNLDEKFFNWDEKDNRLYKLKDSEVKESTTNDNYMIESIPKDNDRYKYNTNGSGITHIKRNGNFKLYDKFTIHNYLDDGYLLRFDYINMLDYTSFTYTVYNSRKGINYR